VTVVLRLASSWLVKALTVWLTYSLTGRAVSRQRRGAGGRSMRGRRVAKDALRVEWRDSADDIPAEVWDQCFRPPLEGRWLYATLERSGLEEQFTFAYALVMREQSIIAIAPVFTMIFPISILAPDFVSGLLKLGGPLTRPLRFQKTLMVDHPAPMKATLALYLMSAWRTSRPSFRKPYGISLPAMVVPTSRGRIFRRVLGRRFAALSETLACARSLAIPAP
jgi:hypothetical protein